MKALPTVHGVPCLPRSLNVTRPWESFEFCKGYRIGRELAVAAFRTRFAHRSLAALHIRIPRAHSGQNGETAWQLGSQGRTAFASKDCCKTRATAKIL